MAIAYLSLGSNINPERNFCAALLALRRHFHNVALSPVYRSAAVGFDGDDFLNAVARIETTLEPLTLNKWLRALEDSLGRDRTSPRFSSRPLDVDLLLYGNLTLRGPKEIKLPRPELEEQLFVLKPMVDLAPDLVHPTRNVTLQVLLNQLGDSAHLRVVQLDCAAGCLTPQRTLNLDGLELVLRIEHAHLSAKDRVEQSESSVEVFKVGLSIQYRPRKGSEGFASVFNYASFVDAVQKRQQSSWHQPLEELTDALLAFVLESARQQNIIVDKASVRIERPELAGIHITILSEWNATTDK